MAKKPKQVKKLYQRKERESDVVVVLNPGKSLHKQASLLAEQSGLTLNEYIVQALEVKLGTRQDKTLLKVQKLLEELV